jgi:hypothetical protein
MEVALLFKGEREVAIKYNRWDEAERGAIPDVGDEQINVSP